MTRQEALALLDLAGDPTKSEIDSAYKTMATKYHPDKFAREKEVVQEVMNEKMRAINEAKAVLDGTSHSSGHESQSDAPKTMESVNTFIARRQFADALKAIDGILRREGENPAFLSVKAEILSEMGDYQESYRILNQLSALDSSLLDDPDFQHSCANIACAAENHEVALLHIFKAIELVDGVPPIYLATKASIYISGGNTKMADQVIQELAVVDPTHPLVQQREEVINVGGTYLGKQDAKQSACGVCIILELIFDCC
jgi:tetratricopeptide (TPR) repeat protein